ncbi:MAG TPA: histidine kinase, partial [Lentimicrobium sp.]|nr:histidine kinase [Lentimicrobium sp.]
TVFEIFEDETGRLWFISFPFQLSYYKNDSIHPYKFNDKLKELAGHGLIPLKKSFYVNSRDEITFSFLNDGKIFKISRNGKLDIIEDITGSLTSVKIREIDNHLIAAQNGIKLKGNFLLSYKSAEFNFFSTIKNANGKFSFGNIMMELTKRKQLIFVRNEFLTLLYKDGSYNIHNLKDRILWMNTEKDTSIWIGKENGGAEKYIIHGSNILLVEKYLEDLGKGISSIFSDNEGGTWFSTLGSGIYYLPSKAFISYTKRDKLSGNNVQSIEIFRDTAYIGSDNYSPDMLIDGKIYNLRNTKNDDKSVNILKAFSDDNLWIGSKTNLFLFSNKRFNKILNNHPKIIKNSLKRKYIFSIKDIYPLSPNSALLAQMRSISIVDSGKVVYDSYLDDNISLRVEAIEKETGNSYLLGTFNGLWRFSNRKLTYIGKDYDLLRKRITAIIVLPNNKGYVVGTKGFGIIIKLNGKFFTITQTNGLSSNSITSLALNNNILWVATNNGLNKIIINSFGINPKIVVFLREQGLISNEINRIKTKGKILYIGCNGGLTIFDTEKYLPLKNSPPIFINNLSILKQDTVIKNGYELKYNQNFITIRYGGVNFRDAGQLLYKYRLIGLSNKWVYSRNLQVEYAFLPSGNFKFEVYAINSEGLISLKPATLEFRIKPPYWKTWWFISFNLLVLLFLFYTYFNLRIKTLRKEHSLQSDISRYREQALIRQMDPHFVFNSLNSIQSFIIRNDIISSTHYLSRFARLMRVILNNSQKQSVRMSDEIDALKLYMELESMRFSDRFEYEITVDPTIDTDLTYIPPFLVQPFVENSIWHGIMHLDRPGYIHVDFLKDDLQIICTIEDNGIGRTKSMTMKTNVEKNRKSLGISIVESRLNLLSDYYNLKLKIIVTDIVDSKNIIKGTKVVINVPILR